MQLEAFESWLYRRMLRIPRTARISNINAIKTRKLRRLGRVMRNESRRSILRSIVQGKIFGKTMVWARPSRFAWRMTKTALLGRSPTLEIGRAPEEEEKRADERLATGDSESLVVFHKVFRTGRPNPT